MVAGSTPRNKIQNTYKKTSPLLAIFLVALLLFLFYCLFFQPWLFVWLTYEDLVGEWAQWFAFFIASIYSIRIAVQSQKNRPFYSLMSIVLVYVVLEEISWGQRIIGFSSPQFFKENNIQGETNIHNFFTGPIGTNLKLLLTIIVSLCLAIYGLSSKLFEVYKTWAQKTTLNKKTNRILLKSIQIVDSFGIEPPPLALAPFFILAGIFELGLFSFNEAEVAELLAGLGLCFQMIIRYKQNQPQKTKLSLLFVMLFIPAFSIVVTISLLQIDHIQKPTQNRLNNGYVKFAKRYQKYNAHHRSYELFERAYTNGKTQTSVVTGMAKQLKRIGKHERAREWLKLALHTLEKKHIHNPQNIKVILSLAQIHRHLKNKMSSQAYLKKAMSTADKKLISSPGHPYTIFLKGRIYLNMGDKSQAAVMFQRAYRRKPERLLYRKKFFKYKKYLNISH